MLWAVTRKGTAMPVNPTPSQTGNVLLAVQDGQLVAGVLGRNQAAGARDRGQRLHRSHFTDCPHADQHRRRRA